MTNEFLKMQKLAGIITESQYQAKLNEKESLSPEEKEIADDILNSLNEGFGDVLDKIKKYTKKGLLSATILLTLLSSPNFSQAEKIQIQQTAKTEMAAPNQVVKTDISKMSNIEAYNYVHNLCKNDPNGILKQLEMMANSPFYYKNDENKADINMLIAFVKSINVKDTKEEQVYLGSRFKMASNVVNNLTPHTGNVIIKAPRPSTP